MNRKFGAFLLLCSAGLLYLLYRIILRPDGRYFILGGLSEYFWVPALGALLCILLGGAALSRSGRRKKAGKKARLSGFASGLLIVLAAVQAGITVFRLLRRPDYCMLHRLLSPDGQHSIYRCSKRDILGNSTYMFVVRQNLFFGRQLFDTDELLPQFQWKEGVLTFRGSDYPLTGDFFK